MPRHLKFSHKILLAATLVVIAAFALFSLYNDVRQRASIRDDLQARLDLASEAAAGNIQSWLGGRILLAESMAQSLERTLAAGGDTQAVLAQPVFAQAFLSSYFGVDGDGRFQVAPPAQMAPDYDPRKRPWYQDTVRAGRSTLTAPYVDKITNALVVSVLAPIRLNGQLYGVAGGDLSLDALDRIINRLDLGGLGHAFLVSKDGTVLVHPQDELVMKNLAELYPGQRIVMDGHISAVEQNGQTRLLAFAPVQGLPDAEWYVGLSIDETAAFAPLGAFRLSAAIATLVAVLSIVLLLGLLMRVLMRPLNLMSRAMGDIAQGEGDLTRRLDVHSGDEFGELAGAFNRFVERIHASIREVASSTGQLNEVASQVLAVSNASMHNSDEQASRTNSVAAAINQLGAAAQEIARNAADASGEASAARQQAEDGRQVVQRTIAALSELSGKISTSCGNIEALNHKTANIGQILEVIKSISEQTNLLALNAAIEAARAGDAGRGFAVVADEVRNLAHRTQESAQEIHTMIEALQVGAREAVTTMQESQRYSEQSVEIANTAGERLGSVTARIGEIDGMNQSVATATEEQTSVIEALNMDITEINVLNQDGVNNLESTLRACSELERQATLLKQLVGSFRI